MPQITVGDRSFVVPPGIRLVLALEQNGVDILHRCGGNARCTTCRVEILAGEPPAPSETELAILQQKGYPKHQYRLSCQLRVERDLTVRPVMTVAIAGVDPGPKPAD